MTCVGSPTPRRPRFSYLDFAAASGVVASARQRARELGDPALAPPGPLENCDRNTLELALAKPRSSFGRIELYPTLSAKAAALLYGLAKSQSCHDGNKRIALLLVVAFVRLNRAQLEVRPLELADMILAAAVSDPNDHDRVIATLDAWLVAHVREEEP